MRKPLQGIARAMLFCMGFHWIKVKGKLSSSEEAPILAVAPHSSFIDALALSVICLPSGVSRKENDSIPLIGGLFSYFSMPVTEKLCVPGLKTLSSHSASLHPGV